MGAMGECHITLILSTRWKCRKVLCPRSQCECESAEGAQASAPSPGLPRSPGPGVCFSLPSPASPPPTSGQLLTEAQTRGLPGPRPTVPGQLSFSILAAARCLGFIWESPEAQPRAVPPGEHRAAERGEQPSEGNSHCEEEGTKDCGF